MPTASERYIVLRGGLTIPAEPYLLLLELEARGLTVKRDGEMVIVTPKGHLTDADRDAIRKWKGHVLSLLDYIASPPEVQ